MLHVPTSQHPPQMIAPTTAARQPRKSALNFIRADIQPLGDYPDLLDKLCYLKDENNIAGVIALYDAYVAMANGILLIQNQPRARYVDDFLEEEAQQAWAKAYLAADFLKDMQPESYDAENYARVLFDCALQMGGNVFHAVAIAKEIGALFKPEHPMKAP